MSTTAAELIIPAPTDTGALARILSFINAHEPRHGSSSTSVFFWFGCE